MRWAVALVLLAQFFLPHRASINHDQLKRDTPDDGIALCRLVFTSNRTEAGGNGWRTDYPKAEEHLQIRLGELTTAHVAMDGEDPIHWAVEATSPALHRCPFLLANDVGTLVWSAEEVDAMRAYLGKGGLLWVDDSWGHTAWAQWMHAFYQVVPGGSVWELRMSHPVFNLHHRVARVPQISNLHFWSYSGGNTSERGEDSPRGEMHGGYDREGRLVVLMTWNTDILDGAEREADSEAYFNAVAADAYALGINVVLYALSH